MITFLLTNWRFFAGAATAFAVAYMLHSLDINRLENRQRAELAAAVQKANEQCQKDKQLTTEVSHGYQIKITALNSQLAAYKLRPSKCIVPVAVPTARHDAATACPVIPGAHGVPSDSLYDYAGDAEKTRLQLLSCQGFITATWAANGS